MLAKKKFGSTWSGVVGPLAWCLLSGAVATPALAQGTTQIIVLSGNVAPDGNGEFSGLNGPALNASGELAFFATLTGTSGEFDDNNGVFRGVLGAVTQIAREGQAAPDGNGVFFGFNHPALNESGAAAFRAVVTDTSGGVSDDIGIFRGTGGAITQIAREGQAAPDGNGTFASLVDPALNNSGAVVFEASLNGTSGGSSDNTGIFRGSGGALTQIAREGAAAPDGNGVYSSFDTPALNDSGEAAFRASLIGTSGGVSDNEGIFRGRGGAVTQIVRDGQQAPDGNGAFTSFTSPALNDSGQVAFRAVLIQTSGGTHDNTGIFRGAGGVVTQLAREGQAAPDGNGAFSSFTIPAINASGQAAFIANLNGTSGGTSDDRGLFLSAGGAITQLARQGQAAPDGNGVFLSFGDPALNGAGEAAFFALHTGTVDGTNDDGGIFLANGIDILQVAREGAALAGSTITGLDFNDGAGPSGDGRSGFNDTGQVAYEATLADGNEAIVLFTIPDLRWTASASSAWSDQSNWTQTTAPNSFHHTTINPTTSLTVTAPNANTTVKSLTLGGGAGVATLRLSGSATGDLRALQASEIAATGVLHLSDDRTFSAPSLVNSGTIRGAGTVDAVLTNAGRIEAIDMELAFSQRLANRKSNGFITGRDAIFRFDGDLINDGALALSFGTSDVFGDIENTDVGTIAIAGNSSATFYDDVKNDGALNVAEGSTAVFFGALAGNGNVGRGDVQALGDLLPGSSPGVMSFGGDLVFGPASTLEIEIGGATPGAEYDRIEAEGVAALDGTLKVELIDLGSGVYEPQLGDSFAFLASNGGAGGMWHTLDLPELAPGLAWMLNPGGVTVSLNVVAALPGDYNLDGQVDAVDYAVWRESLGMTGAGLAADGDLSGTVDSADFAIWQANYGATLPASASLQAPEPAALLLLVFAAALPATRRR